jgi:phage tail-like protein
VIDQMLMDNFVSGAYFDVVLGGSPMGMSGRFTSVSGLGMQFEYETVREGGSMYPRYFFKYAVPQTLVLEQGTVTTVDSFSAWVSMVNSGMSVPLAGVVTLNDHRGKPMRTWTIAGAHIVRYVGPSLDSNRPQLAVNRIELLYGGCS